MAKKKKTNENYINSEISLDELNKVSGGRVKIAGYGLLLAFVKQFKVLGKDKEYAIQQLIEGWNNDSKFRKSFTDGTDGDLQKAIDYVNEHWDQII